MAERDDPAAATSPAADPDGRARRRRVRRPRRGRSRRGFATACTRSRRGPTCVARTPCRCSGRPCSASTGSTGRREPVGAPRRARASRPWRGGRPPGEPRRRAAGIAPARRTTRRLRAMLRRCTASPSRRRPLVAAAPRADHRPRPDHHARRLRGAGGLDGHATGRPRARRARALRLGLLGVLPRLADRHRGRRRRRSTGAGWRVPFAAGPGAVRASACWSAAWRRRCRSWSPPGSSRASAPGTIPPIAYVAIGRSLPERAAAADVRDAVDRLDPAGRHRPGDRRRRSARRSAGGTSSSACCRSSRSPGR